MAVLSVETMNLSIPVEEFPCSIESISLCEQNPPHNTPLGHRQLAQCVTFEESRNLIREKFANYHQLLSHKELELISELDQLEADNQPELFHVKRDLKRLYDVIGTWDDSLGTNTLKPFLERQKSIWEKEIQNFERSEALLSHLSLNYSDFNKSIETIMEIVPYRTKARFRTELEPLLELELKMGEERFVVSQKWFSEFTAAINLYNPQHTDSWEFPESIPIDHSGIYANGQITNSTACQTLHSKAWNLLLGFHTLMPGFNPIKRIPFINPEDNKVELPIVPITHKCYIGHNSVNSKFNIQIDIKCFPTESYSEVLNRISKFSCLMTTFPPKLFSYTNSYTITWSPTEYKYTVDKPNPILPTYAPIRTNTPFTAAPVYSPSDNSFTANPISTNSQYFAPTTGLYNTNVVNYGNTHFPYQPMFHSSVPIVPNSTPLSPLKDLNSQIGLSSRTFLFLIPDSNGTSNMQVVSNVPELTIREFVPN